jgi:hypothetical protein
MTYQRKAERNGLLRRNSLPTVPGRGLPPGTFIRRGACRPAATCTATHLNLLRVDLYTANPPGHEIVQSRADERHYETKDTIEDG